MAKCNACGAEIRFVVTKGGRFIPLDVNPPADISKVKIETAEGPIEAVPHWATCPFADKFKSKQKRGADYGQSSLF